MTLPHVRTDLQVWPGLDLEFQERASAAASTPRGSSFLGALTRELVHARGKSCHSGPPLLVRPAHGSVLRRFARTYHQMIQAVVAAYLTDATIRELLAIPRELFDVDDLAPALQSPNIHLCRIDLMLDRGGGFQVLETNANCPGAVLSMGVACRRWREFLAHEFIDIPEPLDHEWENWMANWFIQTAILQTGEEPSFVPLIREAGGNRLELSGLTEQLHNEGIPAVEVDPREIRRRAGTTVVAGRRTRHAYLKLGVPEFRSVAGEARPLRDAMRSGTLFVPNGVLGRFVGDNKLCLAVLSDPKFHYLFDPADLEFVSPHIPFSRAVQCCDSALLRDIRENPHAFVLKRPLDTKGRGVIIGREMTSRREWRDAVTLAQRENWLVQEFCSTTQMESDFGGNEVNRHDLSLGVTNGELAGIIARSSSELRLNVARSGRLHPVFVAS